MKRRSFLAASAAVGTAGSTSLKPALAKNNIEWNMVTCWPRGLNGVGAGAKRIAQRIHALSDGQLNIQVHYAKELVPTYKVFDTVAQGTVAQAGHSSAFFNTSRTRAADFFSSIPFGMTAIELSSWIRWGGGQKLWDETYAPFGIKPFLAGNTGTQMGGWFRKEINTPSDFQNLRIRIIGQGAEVMQQLGAKTVLLPGGETVQALKYGQLDAAEWIGPGPDMDMGFHRAAQNYYYPGFHAPGPGIEFIVNLAAYQNLPTNLQKIVKTATEAEIEMMLSESVSHSSQALQRLTKEHHINVKAFPDDVLIALGNASGKLIREIIDDPDPQTRKVARAYVKARSLGMKYNRISEQALMNARQLGFDYPEN